MKIGIMQPYFMPYLAYWKLIAMVDKYIIYDDVSYMKGGWINRNRILNCGNVQNINIQVKGASSFKLINEIELVKDVIYEKKREKTIWNAYYQSSEFEKVFPIIQEILNYPTNNLSEFLTNSIRRICEYLQIETEILIASNLDNKKNLKGEEKVLDICKIVDADIYINAIGGKELYDKKHFQDKDIQLFFLKSEEVVYKQIKTNDFVADLSIIDVLMNNSICDVKKMLSSYALEEGM